MATLQIEIKLDNAAFDGLNPEIEAVRILLELAKSYELGLTDRKLRDFNGNVVGFSRYVLED